jgi:hypothetical protein
MPRAFPSKLKAYVSAVPKAAPASETVVEKQFVQDLIRSGRARRREPGKELPEYEIVDENTVVRHYVA